MFSSFIHVVTCISTPFFFMLKYYFIQYEIYHNVPQTKISIFYLFISWWTCSLFLLLATMNNTTVNNHEQVSVWIHWLLSKDMGGLRARPENLWNYRWALLCMKAIWFPFHCQDQSLQPLKSSCFAYLFNVIKSPKWPGSSFSF